MKLAPGFDQGRSSAIAPPGQEGWLRDQENFAKQPRSRADGVVWQAPEFSETVVQRFFCKFHFGCCINLHFNSQQRAVQLPLFVDFPK